MLPHCRGAYRADGSRPRSPPPERMESAPRNTVPRLAGLPAQHGFSAKQTGMTFLRIGVGMVGAMCCMPFRNQCVSDFSLPPSVPLRLSMEGELTLKAQDIRMRKLTFNDHPPPETRMIMGQVGGILVPIGLSALAFAAYTSVPWIFQIPIIASIPCVSPPCSALEARP
ncbi:hypothetical protein FIBSPDRAFT_187126 [Athelia psychrophila]|uniref:Uncharacterized protein n=1 Tax=Athelia psychrophila TaxID=1759441 RepID=A0A166A7J0_9AGAM|nr:hypothetical protein FIBSPDRAFT_187126 [Fibularhizoctonia sp. CBS 109695]